MIGELRAALSRIGSRHSTPGTERSHGAPECRPGGAQPSTNTAGRTNQPGGPEPPAASARCDDRPRGAQSSTDTAGRTNQPGGPEPPAASARGEDRLRSSEPAAAAADWEARLRLGRGL